jgi:leucyl/phenylalanyl-tRNA---protein transferase
MTTEHMISLGAREVSRRKFLKQLRSALEHPTRRGKWRIKD